jgi:hypothetical protein
MGRVKWLRAAGVGILLALCAGTGAKSGLAQKNAQAIKTVFVIAMENHNWTQPVGARGGAQIYENPNAPFINSLVKGTAEALIDGKMVRISEQVAYATAYHNVLATPSGNNPHIHPSEPNYIWAEAGANFGVLNDSDPYVGGTNQNTRLHLSSLLTQAGKTWKSYQEDIDLTLSGGKPSSVPLPQAQWTVPLTSLADYSGAYFNAYNGHSQYGYAAKHNPMIFFTDTNGGNDPTPTNPLAAHYAPLQQLMIDLKNGAVADYNWITPNLYNDMHSALSGGYEGLKGDAASVKQGDNFLSEIVPAIMASNAYKNGGVIILWWDETESSSFTEDNADDYRRTIPEIIISGHAHKNVNGLPYASSLNYTHSSDLRTLQNIFQGGPYLGDAANAIDLSDLFEPGVIPKNP